METLYLVPGLLCDAVIWQPQIQALSRQFDIRVPDLRAFDSIDAMAKSILAEAPARFSIAGHSMGARVALEVMRIAPDRVARLALFDTGAHPVGESEPAKRHNLTELSRTRGMSALAESWLPPMVAPSNFHGQLKADLVAMVERMTPEIHRHQIAALLGRPDAVPSLSHIRVPTLVGVGSDDVWSPPSQNRQIADAIPGAEYVVFAGSGHMAPLEAPEAVTSAIAKWMSRAVTDKSTAPPLDALQRSLIEEACVRLINRFAWLNDAQNHAALAELFSEDGSFARPTAPQAPVRGREALLSFFQDRPPRRTQHVMTNIVVEVEDESRARAQSYVTLYSGEGGKDVLVGRYEDRLIRCTDGEWRFQARLGSLTFA